LDLAAHKGSAEVAQTLLDRGADAEAADDAGMRPLDRAVGRGHAEVVGCFLRRGAKLGPATWAAAKDKPDIL